MQLKNNNTEVQTLCTVIDVLVTPIHIVLPIEVLGKYQEDWFLIVMVTSEEVFCEWFKPNIESETTSM